MSLKGALTNKQAESLSESKIKAILFPLPFLIEGQVPEVYVKENNIYIEAGLINDSYIDSLKNHLSSHGLETQLIENKE